MRFIFLLPCLALLACLAITAPTTLLGDEAAIAANTPTGDQLAMQDADTPTTDGERRRPRDNRDNDDVDRADDQRADRRRDGRSDRDDDDDDRTDFRRRRPPELTAEEIEVRLEIYRELNPDLAQHLETQRTEDPARFARMLAHHSPRMSVLIETKKSDPQMYALMIEDMKLGRASHELSRNIRRALKEEDEERVAELRRQTADIVEQHFDVRQQLRERELHNLELRLEEMRRSLAARREARQTLIQERVDQLATGRNERVEF